MNHFEVFGLAPTLELDVKVIEQKHRELSLAHHPDRFANADAKTRLAALEKTTAINDAFKVLKDPVRRAFYVLKLKGVDLENETTAAKTPMPLAFLEEVMDRREALEGVKARRDWRRAKAMAAEVSLEQQAALREAKAALERDDLTEATHQLGRVKYFMRFVEEVEALDEEPRS